MQTKETNKPKQPTIVNLDIGEMPQNSMYKHVIFNGVVYTPSKAERLLLKCYNVPQIDRADISNKIRAARKKWGHFDGMELKRKNFLYLIFLEINPYLVELNKQVSNYMSAFDIAIKRANQAETKDLYFMLLENLQILNGALYKLKTFFDANGLPPYMYPFPMRLLIEQKCKMMRHVEIPQEKKNEHWEDKLYFEYPIPNRATKKLIHTLIQTAIRDIINDYERTQRN